MRNKLFKKFKIKYETVFNWLSVLFDKREVFCKMRENDFKNDIFNTCFEIRLDEIVCRCMDISRKYGKTPKTISSRKRRTQLFLSDIFKDRKKLLQMESYRK
jgi:hypothetical protein